MLITKTKPEGIDIPIQQLQSMLYSRLCAMWGIDPDGTAWQCYGRAYKNQAADGYLPEVFIGGNDYKEVFYDDNHAIISFFGVGDMRQVDKGVHAGTFVIFQLDITKVKPNVTGRGDEEIHNDVLRVLSGPRFGFMVTELITGIDNVYSDYTLYKRHTGQSANTDSIKYRDMHPLHCFRVNMDLIYKNSNC